MLRPRIIPCLLMYEGALVKTVKFTNPKYIGDPLNTVKIFNEKQADELIVLDIGATKNSMKPNFDLISKLAAECRMPLCYGGGVTTVDQAIKLVDMGVEKVAVSSAAIKRPSFVKELVAAVGSQSVVVILDILLEKNFFSFDNYKLYTNNGKVIHKEDPFIFFKKLQDAEVGEIVINSINNDGIMQGYDLNLAHKIKSLANTPVTFLGGAGNLLHIEELIENLGIVGAAAGSLFIFKGKYKAVLINYPTLEKKIEICDRGMKVYNKF
jgi:cyclase